MFTTQTKAVLQNKSESNKKQLSAKALLPDQTKRNTLLDPQEART